MSMSTRAAGRIGGLTTVARHGGDAMTRKARDVANDLQTWRRKVIEQQGPQEEPLLTEKATAMRRAHYARIGSLGGQAKRRR